MRSGGDETIVNDQRDAAADLVGEYVYESYQLAEDVERVRELLANAPADRSWRRRGLLVLCRAYPDGVRQTLDISSLHAGTIRTTRSGGKLERAEAGPYTATAGGSAAVDERSSSDWAGVVAMVLG